MLGSSLTRRRFFASIAGGCLAWPCIARAASHQSGWPAVREALDSLVRERRVPGLSLAAAYGVVGSPSYINSGHVAFGAPEPFDENSICRIYSITKHVTKTAALLLVEDGALSLDQPVVTVLPEFAKLRVLNDITKGLDSRPAVRTMTMRHLLTDTSGLGNWTPGSDSGEELHRLYRERGITPGSFGSGRRRPGFGPQPATLEDLVARVAELPLAYEPGAVVHYSIGFDVMALVIQRVAGKPYDVFLEERIFRPLGMDSTGFHVSRQDRGRLTTNYDATEGHTSSAPGGATSAAVPAEFRVQDDRQTSDWLDPPRLISGGGGLVSTARDLLLYAQMLLDDGAFGRARVMRQETARLATGSLVPPDAAEPSGPAGAGTRGLLRTPIVPPGTTGGGGAAGTLWWIDRKRHGAVVFMAQTMYGSPARSPSQPRLFPALERDLAAGGESES